MQTKTKYNIKYIQKVQHTKLCSQKFGDVFFLNATKLLKLTINTGSLGSAGKVQNLLSRVKAGLAYG